MAQTARPIKNNLEDQVQALRALSAGVAHEIKNPLATIQSLVQLLEKRTQDPSQKKLACAIVSEVQRLNHFLGEFLQFSKTPELKPEPVAIKPLIEKALTFALEPALNTKIKTQIEISDKMPPAFVDPAAFQQVLLNVINNAVQSMKNGGRLSILARVSNRNLEIQIKDTGVGIPSEQLSRIFEPFFTTKRGGTGLGLAISQQIITRHGGTLYFKKNQDKGMTLFIEVPQKQKISNT